MGVFTREPDLWDGPGLGRRWNIPFLSAVTAVAAAIGRVGEERDWRSWFQRGESGTCMLFQVQTNTGEVYSCSFGLQVGDLRTVWNTHYSLSPERNDPDYYVAFNPGRGPLKGAGR